MTIKTFYCRHCNLKTIMNRGKNYYCSAKCQHDYQWINKKIPEIEAGKVKQSPTHRKYLTETRGYICEGINNVPCGIHKWNNSTLVLQVDHIDGNPDNNFPSNLRLLCPNCHSLTSTYKGGNKNTPKTDSRSTLHRDIYRRKRESLDSN